MRYLALALLGLVLVACDYEVALVEKPETKIDRGLLGVWEGAPAGEKAERLLILPLSETQYMVAFPAGSEHTMFAKACLTKIADTDMAQLEWFGTIQGDLADDGRLYQYVTYSLVGDTLTIRLLSTKAVPKTVKTGKELAQGITDGMDQPGLFGEPMIFRRAEKK